MSREVTVGLLNVSMKINSLKERRENLIELVTDAGRRGCNIVLLPEWATHHRCTESLELHGKPVWASTVGMKMDHPFLKTMAQLARQHKMVVIPDPLLLGPKANTNTCIVYGPSGKVLGTYSKTHLAPGEGKTVARGADLKPIDTPFGRLGLLICYDINFPELTRCHELNGAELLLWTTMRQGGNEEGLYRCRLPARCMEHHLPFGVSTWVTEDQARSLAPMASILYNHYGQVVAGGQTEPGVVVGTVDLDAHPTCQRCWGEPEVVRSAPYARRQRRPDLYGPLVQRLNAEQADPEREPVVATLTKYEHL